MAAENYQALSFLEAGVYWAGSGSSRNGSPSGGAVCWRKPNVKFSGLLNSCG